MIFIHSVLLRLVNKHNFVLLTFIKLFFNYTDFFSVQNEQVQLATEVDEDNNQLAKLTEQRQELMYLVDGGQKELTAKQVEK